MSNTFYHNNKNTHQYTGVDWIVEAVPNKYYVGIDNIHLRFLVSMQNSPSKHNLRSMFKNCHVVNVFTKPMSARLITYVLEHLSLEH